MCKTTVFFIWFGSQISMIAPVSLVITERRVLMKSPVSGANAQSISPGYSAKQVRIFVIRICLENTLISSAPPSR